ncbi:MAG: hypothetical protein GX269_01370 [Clostridiales bacterium]|jgi:uncharacterized membrane protein YfcA|nr:hypothetical protein [Clostridiales bacterium]
MKSKKLIIPIIITVLIVAVLAFYAFIYISAPIPNALKVIISIFLLFLLSIAIYVLVERIKEVRSGEYDDISKY